MENLPVNTIVNVVMTNGRSILFKVDATGIEIYRLYGYAFKRFRSIHSAHRFCSAFGNIQSVTVQEQGTGYWFSKTLGTLTSGQFQRSKLPQPSK